MIFYSKNRHLKKPDIFLYSDIIFKTFKVYLNLPKSFFSFYLFNLVKSFYFLNFQIFSNFILTKFTPSFLFFYHDTWNFSLLFKNNNMRIKFNFVFIKLLLVLYFFIYKKNFINLFSLNFFNNISNLYYSIKNLNQTSFMKLNMITNNKNMNYDFNLILKRNLNLQNLLSLNNKFYNFFFNSKCIINKFFNVNFISSFFIFWNFLLFLPLTNFFFNSFFNKINNFFFFKYNSKSKNLLNWNISLFKYFNFFDFNFFKDTFSKLFFFRKLRMRVLKLIEDSHFSDILTRLVGSISGMKVYLFLNKSLKKQLTTYEWNRFDLLRRRFRGSISFKFYKLNTRFLQKPAQYVFGRKFNIEFYWFELTLVCFMSFKLKDTNFLMTYLYNKMRRMSLFKHRTFLRRIFFVLKVLMNEIGPWYSIVGVKMKITGKISVTGNSRTRTMHFKQGIVSNSNMTTRVDYSFTIIKTNTGCLGMSIWFFF